MYGTTVTPEYLIMAQIPQLMSVMSAVLLVNLTALVKALLAQNAVIMTVKKYL